MVDPKSVGLSIVLGITLVLNPGSASPGPTSRKRRTSQQVPRCPKGPSRSRTRSGPQVGEATKAADRKDWAAAERLYAQILEEEPDLTPVRSAYANALARVGKPAEAVEQLDKAIGPKPTFEKLVAGGVILRGTQEDAATSHPSQASTFFQRALDMGVSEEGMENADAKHLGFLAKLALRLEQTPQFINVLGKLRARFPDAKETHYFRGIHAAMNEAWLTADDELARARALGMPWSCSATRCSSRSTTSPNPGATRGTPLTQWERSRAGWSCCSSWAACFRS